MSDLDLTICTPTYDVELKIQNGVILITYDSKKQGFPNAFQRLMYRILLGWKWTKIE